MTEKDKILAEEAGDALVEGGLAAVDAVVFQGLPGLTTAWKLCKALLGAGLRLRTARALEWVEMVRDNPHVFGEKLLEDESFQDAFVLGLENYIKLRHEEKRAIARTIFLGLASSNDRDRFALERLHQALGSISVEAIEYLVFLDETIIPRMRADIEAEAARITQNQQKGDEECQWWIKAKWQSETVWDYFEKWLHEEYDPNSDKVKEKYHYNKETSAYDVDVQDIFDIETKLRVKGREMMAEYVSLGLFRVDVKISGGLGGGGGSVQFTITDFGWQFLEYVNGYKIFSPKLDV